MYEIRSVSLTRLVYSDLLSSQYYLPMESDHLLLVVQIGYRLLLILVQAILIEEKEFTVTKGDKITFQKQHIMQESGISP